MIFKRQWVEFYTISIKEITRVINLGVQAFLPPSITMSLYFIIFGKMIGSHMPMIHGFSYMQYITPGLIIMPTITAAYMNTAMSFFIGKFQRNIEEVLVSPTPNYIIILGFLMGALFRALILAIIVTIVSLFFTKLHIHSLFIMFFTVFLTAVLFGQVGLINGIFARKFDDASIVPVFVLTPLTYLGGVFYSIKSLSPFWYHVSLFNPIMHIVDAFRYGMLGIADANVTSALTIIVLFVVSTFLINLYLLRKGFGIRQ